MSKLIFKPGDFEHIKFNGEPVQQISTGVASDIAQSKFDKWISEAVRVYGTIVGDKIKGYAFVSNQHDDHNSTALLVDITPIKRECKHEPGLIYYKTVVGQRNAEYSSAECKHCGIALVAKWEPK